MVPKDKTFKFSLIASAGIHLLMILFLPVGKIYHPSMLRFTEVSLVVIPGVELKMPGAHRSKSRIDEEKIPIPSTPQRRVWSPGKGEPLARIDTQKRFILSKDASRMPQFGERPAAKLGIEKTARVGEKEMPGLDEKTGLLKGEGETDDYVITGPVSQRNLLRWFKPTYPRWAEVSGIEGEALLRFWVLPNGQVSKVQVEQTSGHVDLDQSAIVAIKKWLFEQLSSQEEQTSQWGTITIKFKLE